MYIKSIVLDGFKSYGNRVEITGFDPEFNAITGLNGTGKSNILDSICFVLGITNLSNVRAGSLQELIYKHGQAGITKATVSITFDNTNKAQQPIGYDSKEITVTRQVVMGGKNKYMINGNNVQNKRVSDLFCSVQLNVNNPHFLIMQGRITKVLNMKPPEILSMVEEAAGTRMYEAKKQSAEKIIEKKDAKLRELNDIIKEDIAPRLQKLQDERSQFQEYQKVVRELDTLSKLHVAWKYVSAEEKSKEADGKVAEVRDNINQLKEEINNNKQQMKDIANNIDKLNKELDQESGSTLASLEQALQEAERREAGAAAALKANNEAVTQLQRRLQALQRSLNDDTAALQDKRNTEEKVTATFSDIKCAHEAAEAALEGATQRFLAVSSGLEGGSGSLQDRLMAARKGASEAATQAEQAHMQRGAAQARLQRLQRDFDAHAAAYTRDRDSIARHEALLRDIQSSVSRLQFDEAENSSLGQRRRSLESSVRRQRDTVDSLATRLQRCNFNYTKPSPDFDDSRVSGTVCRLFSVCDTKYCTAIETAAGGKLYNVVVDTELTSKLLLQRGRLTTRTTIIPLNKIRGHVIDQRIVKLAQDVGGGPENVQLALDLVSYERALHPALSWVLGGTLVCKDLETARRVTFHPGVRRRTVTLDGDVCDPAGTLSGGAALKGGSVLVQLQELRLQEQQLLGAEQQLAAAAAQLLADKDKADKYHALKHKEEMTSHELTAARSRLATTSHQQLHDEIALLKQQIETLTASIERDNAIQKENAAEAKELEEKVKDIKGHRDREFKKAQDALAAARKAAEQHGAAWKQREQQAETLRLETLELEQAVATAQQQLHDLTHSLQHKKDELAKAKEEHHSEQESVKEVQSRVKHHKQQISRGSSELRQLATQREQLADNNRAADLHIQQLELDVKELHAEADSCRKKISSLEREHPWISSEREYFGAAGGVYDFTARAASTSGARLTQLTARRDKLARGLNARAHTLLGKEEDTYRELLRKKAIVEADRAKLVQVIQQLDEKKERTLVAACERVTRDFGSIFSTLLPGAHAELAAPGGRSVLEGLEVRVGFNGLWKSSLGELSGGQRSLVALSLVLALLLFKPAPLYILDEVDAALDLSHTQNIGIMLKEHFKHSQFIIVSLKDGMFNNANVLFRTRFVDGMSSVQRTLNTNRK